MIVKLWPGKSETQKRRLADRIAQDVMDVLGYGEESVSVALEEVEPRGWAEQVTFEPVEGQINDRIDDAYRTKYHASPYLSPMLGARARSATVKVMPLETNV